MASVLIVDNDSEMRALLTDFLQQDGHQVIARASGEDAIVSAEVERVDIAIVDKEMPGMNGLDVVAHLGLRCPDLPVILITAFGGPRVAEDAVRRGAKCYLEKPFRLTQVRDAVERLLAARAGPASRG